MISEITSSINFEEYNKIINQNESTFYQSVNHLKFLESILKLKANYISIKDKNKLVGVMPYFEKKEEYGIVINSLPFFGSYGGIISNSSEIDKKILDELNSINKEKDILSSVIIDNPFNTKNKLYSKKFVHNVFEERLIQCAVIENNKKEDLWNKFEQRVRRSVRKSEKNEIKVVTENIDENHLENFYKLHVDSMKIKNGKNKPKQFFSSLLKNFESKKDYEIFTAMKENKPIAYLLVFYHKNMAEYYMPAYDPKYISFQSTSHLIWESIKKAMDREINYYNFGGTWKDQNELYRFKRGWNADDFNYKYFINRDLDRINEVGIKRILEKYQYFYISPFTDFKNDRKH